MTRALTLIEVADACGVSLDWITRAHEAGLIGRPVTVERQKVRYSVADVNKLHDSIRAFERRESTAAFIAERQSKRYRQRPTPPPLPAGGTPYVKKGCWGSKPTA